MQPRPLANPPNPWASTAVEYLEGPPLTSLQVFEDHTRDILAKNDSPDLPFRWSINPYRGCMHACAYCLVGETPILLADGRTRPLADLRVGDQVAGTRRIDSCRRLLGNRVLAHWSVDRPAVRVVVEDGTSIVCSADHRFLTRRGWKHATGAAQGRERRSHLTLRDELVGTGRFAAAPDDSVAYRCGYLCGVLRGDGPAAVGSWDPERGGGEGSLLPEALRRARTMLASFGVETDLLLAGAGLDRLRELVDWPGGTETLDGGWCKGFLAGMFDAAGSRGGGELRIGCSGGTALAWIERALERLGLRSTTDGRGVQLTGGLREQLRFLQTVDPAVSHKRAVAGEELGPDAALRVTAVEPLGVVLKLYDITTETGDFIADGIVSHNCYARPTHEYLSFGAGTDFDTKIVIKPRAAELLRDAFERPSWKGEHIMFSGNTDCYQPLEASYGLTRACLEACLEYRNPIGVITKAPLIERDVSLLAELARVAGARVTVSIPFWDAETARAIEPTVATPQRRVRTIARLAEAGIPVGVNVAPIIPGLSDEDLADVLAAARQAGARWAGMVMLRLPGSVKEVFETRLRAALPLRADKVLNRIRDTRGGKLYDARFGTRQRGEGPYAEAIRAFFDATCRRLGFDAGEHDEPPTTFRRPNRSRQLTLGL